MSLSDAEYELAEEEPEPPVPPEASVPTAPPAPPTPAKPPKRMITFGDKIRGLWDLNNTAEYNDNAQESLESLKKSLSDLATAIQNTDLYKSLRQKKQKIGDFWTSLWFNPFVKLKKIIQKADQSDASDEATKSS